MTALQQNTLNIFFIAVIFMNITAGCVYIQSHQSALSTTSQLQIEILIAYQSWILTAIAIALK